MGYLPTRNVDESIDGDPETAQPTTGAAGTSLTDLAERVNCSRVFLCYTATLCTREPRLMIMLSCHAASSLEPITLNDMRMR